MPFRKKIEFDFEDANPNVEADPVIPDLDPFPGLGRRGAAIGKVPPWALDFIQANEGARIRDQGIRNEVLMVAPDWKLIDIPKKVLSKSGPSDWDILLRSLKEIYDVDAVVAGGSVRDHILNVPCADIDIFIPNNQLSEEKLIQGAEELGWGHLNKVGKQYADKKGVLGVYKTKVRGFKIDIILLDKPLLLSDFPFNWSQCMYDLENGITRTDEAQADMDYKTVTANIELTEAQEEKIRKKFKDWTNRSGLDFKLNLKSQKGWWE